MMVAIIDYGMGNVASVQKALSFMSITHKLTKEQKEIADATHIILPGVGAFKQGMDNLRSFGLVDCLTEAVIVNKKPFLGICLGMQLIASEGSEPVSCKGLSWIEGKVVRMSADSGLSIPHLGWNNIQVKTPSFNGFEGKDFYFIHSYHFEVENTMDIAATVEYGEPYVAVVKRDNVVAAQFHPEKSQKNGLAFLDFFLKGC